MDAGRTSTRGRCASRGLCDVQSTGPNVSVVSIVPALDDRPRDLFTLRLASFDVHSVRSQPHWRRLFARR